MSQPHTYSVDLPQADEQDLVRILAASAVGHLSPEELDVFDETAQEFFDDPENVLRSSDKDEAVGFGLELAMITPVVLAVVTSVIKFLASIVAAATKETATPVLVGTLRRLLHIRDDGAATPAAASPLDAGLIQRVHEIAFQRAITLGLPEDRARLLADAVAGGIVVPD
jgi:hypothetical protein